MYTGGYETLKYFQLLVLPRLAVSVDFRVRVARMRKWKPALLARPDLPKQPARDSRTLALTRTLCE